MKKEDVQKALRENEFTRVKFTKADGTERTMLCTSNLDQLIRLSYDRDHDVGPIDISEVTTDDPDADVAKVYDIEVKGWRSFRFDRLISFEGVNV